MALVEKRARFGKTRCLLSVGIGILAAQSLTFRNVDSSAFDNFGNLAALGLDSIAQVGQVGSAALAVGIGFLFYKLYPEFEKAERRNRLTASIVACFLAFTVVLPRLMKQAITPFNSYPNYLGGVPRWQEPIFWLVALVQVLSIGSALAVGICWLMHKAADLGESGKPEDGDAITTPGHDSIWGRGARLFDGASGHLVLATVAMLLCWTPMLIIQGPAKLGLDTMVQLIQFRTDHVWDPIMMVELPGYAGQDHHPFVDTYLYGFFDEIGLWLGHEIVGFCILIVLQSIATAFALVVSFIWLRNRTNLPDSCVCICWCLAAFLPAFPMYMSTIVKDSTWIPLFLLWLVAFFEALYRCSNHQAIGWKLVTCLIVLGVLSGLTKKTGIYVTTLSLLLLIIFLRKQIISLFLSMLVPAVLVMGFVPMVVLPALDIAPGGPQEALSVPIQQLSKVAMVHKDELSESDRQAIDKVVDIKRMEPQWRDSSADYAKHYGYKINSSSEDRIQFIKTWVRLFFHYPKDYIAAVPYLVDSFVFGDTYYYSGPVRCGWWEAGGYKILPGYSECKPSYTQEKIGIPLNDALNKLPPFSFLGSEALYTVWLPLMAMALVVANKRYRNMLYLIPSVVNWCSLLLLAASSSRYSLCFLFMFALTIAVPFVKVERHELHLEQAAPAKR